MSETVLPILTTPTSAPGSPEAMIRALLDDQSDLTAVERFSRSKDDPGRPEGARHYAALMPGVAPGPGRQYAFEVDLDRCSGCKACVAACHALNGLDEGESWREVGLILGGGPDLPVLQHVTTSCHHCLDPACLNACPVDAYEKDPLTGIVRHLDDQCFGCRYCTLACPYDAPKFHPGKGIVRKCDMCAGRLAGGEAPACVQGCPHQAIRIRMVDTADVIAVAESGGWLPTAPGASSTLPTTRYVSSRPLLGPVRSGDHHRTEPEPAHAPLAVMLVLTQAAAGTFALDLAARAAGRTPPPSLAALGLALGFVGVHASLLHLGRPHLAYRALIGLRHSWLSREVAAFGLFLAAAAAHAGAAVFRPGLAVWTAATAAATGAAAVACSVMVYHAVRRPFWHAAVTGPKFAGTSAVLGLSVGLAVAPGSARLAAAVAGAVLIKLAMEAQVLAHLRDPRLTPLKRSALLLRGRLARWGAVRAALGLAGGVALPALLRLVPGRPATLAAAAFALALAGEVTERLLFFRAVARPKMPGGVAS